MTDYIVSRSNDEQEYETYVKSIIRNIVKRVMDKFDPTAARLCGPMAGRDWEGDHASRGQGSRGGRFGVARLNAARGRTGGYVIIARCGQGWLRAISGACTDVVCEERLVRSGRGRSPEQALLHGFLQLLKKALRHVLSTARLEKDILKVSQ